MSKRDLWLLLALFLLAFGLRSWGVATPDRPWGDEPVHLEAASHYWASGHFSPDFWEHPPLRHLLLKGFVTVLGDNPYGWRMRNVLLGAVACVLVALFAFSVDGSRWTAAAAGLLMATDPLHVVLSRFTFEEIYGGAFYLASLVLFMNHRGRSGWLVLSAAFMGCALATKWYYVPAWLLLMAIALREDRESGRPASALFVASAYLLVPAMVYVLSFWPWFGRGYSFGELLEHTVNTYYSLQAMSADIFNGSWPFLRPTSALDWFVAPVLFGQGATTAEGSGQFVVFGNNLPVWAFALPSLALCGYVAVKRRSVRWGAPVLFFLATYALLVLVRRPTFIYSAVPLLPFAFTAIALAASLVAERVGARGPRVLVAAMVASNLYLYPLVTAKDVPLALYGHVLSKVDLTSP
jgi:dolichyl-phosphate-mannose--protein O-mannosyl transferase